MSYQDGHYCLTTLEQLWWEKEMVVIVSAAAGQTQHIPIQRDYTFYLTGIKNPDILTVQVDGIDRPFGHWYDEERECLTVMVVGMPVTAICRVVAWHREGLLARRGRERETLVSYLRTFRLETNVKSAIADNWADIQATPDLLDSYPLTDNQRQVLLDLLAPA